MVEEKPWWRPIADALAAKVAKAIMEYEPTEEDTMRVLDAAFEDVLAKAPRTRRKGLAARPEDRTIKTEK